MNLDKLRLFIRLTRPIFLLGAALLYALGAGIARYLGMSINWDMYILGQAWVSMLQLSTQYLNEYFDSTADTDNPHRTLFSGGSGAIGPGKLSRSTALYASAVTLTITTSLTVLLIRNASVTPLLVFLLALSALGAIFYSVPPVKLSTSGYGELTASILVANLVPAFAFLLQYGDLHRLLAMSTFPLTALHLAMLLAFELPDYSNDLAHGKRTLMIRMGWQNGMYFHNLLIVAAFLLLGLATTLGFPISIALPAFLPLPLGALQIWQMHRIATGIKPNWASLTTGEVVLLALTAYLLTFAFWIG
jgi:1,4-dihydroxy-2-naphthoate octaprenyltransferase